MDFSKVNFSRLTKRGQKIVLEAIEHERKHALFMAEMYEKSARKERK